MENITSRGPTFGDFFTIRTERSMQNDVLRESLSVEIQNIPCATLKRRGSWLVGNLCISLGEAKETVAVKMFLECICDE
jgi:hypothetical protein